MPLPESELSAKDVQAAISRTREDDEAGKWLAVHFLYEECGCSARVLDSLLRHPAGKDVAERIVLVTDGSTHPPVERRARELGYGFVSLSRERATEQYQVQAVPVLAILSPTNALQYFGGYQRKRGPVLEDRDLIRRARAGDAIPPLPTFGCAIGRRLAARANPLNL